MAAAALPPSSSAICCYREIARPLNLLPRMDEDIPPLPLGTLQTVLPRLSPPPTPHPYAQGMTALRGLESRAGRFGATPIGQSDPIVSSRERGTWRDTCPLRVLLVVESPASSRGKWRNARTRWRVSRASRVGGQEEAKHESVELIARQTLEAE